MTEPLNGPVEFSVRALALLTSSYPNSVDLARLTILDHAILHSGDLDGPASLMPDVPLRVGEVGVKRGRLEGGLRVLIRAGLAEMRFTDFGVRYGATEEAESFLELLESNHATELKERARWAVSRYGSLSDEDLRSAMTSFFSHWSEEFSDLLLRSEGRDL